MRCAARSLIAPPTRHDDILNVITAAQSKRDDMLDGGSVVRGFAGSRARRGVHLDAAIRASVILFLQQRGPDQPVALPPDPH